jgi:hypothetical protein
MVAKDRADVSDKRSAALIAAGSVAATAGGAFITVNALEPGKPLTPVWVNTWFDIGFAGAIIGLILAGFGLYLNRYLAKLPGQEPRTYNPVGALVSDVRGSPAVAHADPVVAAYGSWLCGGQRDDARTPT